MGPFLVYLFALVLSVMGGFIGLIKTDGHPLYLIPILFGLFFFWICWEITVGQGESPSDSKEQ
jgi:hypothetical protein